MLVLSRKRDEQIVIGGDIVITIVDVRGDKVRLGIQAPPHVPVHRAEVYQALQAAAGQNTDGVVPAQAPSGVTPASVPAALVPSVGTDVGRERESASPRRPR